MWQALKAHRKDTAATPILELFEQGDRAQDFSVTACGMLFDYSKTAMDRVARKALLGLAQIRGVEPARDAMFAGDKINETEGRAVLHTALRNLDGGPVMVDGEDVMPEVLSTLDRMETFAEAVRSGAFTGQGGKITDVVNIGIGGSDLGPVMAVQALAPYHDGPRTHFVSNIDGAHIADTLRGLDPATTLIIVASKTFTTIETMTNAATARAWMGEAISDPAAQFAALSTAEEKTSAFGIAPERVFGFEDWVGGRYSMWGPIGLSIMLAVGGKAFRAFLRGAQNMDRHFQAADLAENMPVLLALTGMWHHQVCGYPTRAVLPYEQRLLRFPAYLQQMEMESNGKSVQMDGSAVTCVTGPVVWGEPGTNGQHAFYQLIHQGTMPVPCEFLIGAQSHEPELAHHNDLLKANCLAQSEALMLGRDMDEARELMKAAGLEGEELDRQAAHRVFPGNRPSTTLVYPKLTPEVLGQLVALYEHRVFVEGVILGINSYDQWGVELGKVLATKLQPVVTGEASAEGKDGSTQSLVAFLRANG
ncbi:glucose-6-phosphate isomerase [Alphaproteobacteria bacterium KMM 3653]|uniref:Glucose-6-phosphate isomerase n=1 Tax=Harenicola maris TaxID=2841044 RepID=A0AAP2G7M2_9RHOB|nr:glucose-6-phosphate isomerase [Harenicola maris]